jgi:hypothetical protein
MQDKHDGNRRWLNASPEQRRIWHIKNQIKAAEIKGDEERASELKKKLSELSD